MGTEITEIEVIETENTNDTLAKPTHSIQELEQEFNSFIKEMETANETVSSGIQMDELNEIGDEVIKAKQYLTSFASGEKKSVREKAYSQLIALPLIGDWAKEKVEEVQVQQMENSGVKEVLEGIFESFEVKKKRLIELTTMAEGMRENLINQEQRLGKYIAQLDEIIANPPSVADKMRALDMSIIAQAQDRISKEMIYNQLNFIISMMEQLMTKISKTLPTLKNTLNNSLNIVGTINSIKDAVEMMNTLEDLSNEINETSSKNIQELIINVTDSMTDGTNIEFYRESAKRNEEFNATLIESRKKYITTSINNYNELKNIEENSQKMLLERSKAEEELLLGSK